MTFDHRINHFAASIYAPGTGAVFRSSGTRLVRKNPKRIWVIVINARTDETYSLYKEPNSTDFIVDLPIKTFYKIENYTGDIFVVEDTANGGLTRLEFIEYLSV